MIEDRATPAETIDAWLHDCLKATGSAELTVHGSCMEPALRTNARVRLRRPGRLRVGDVVLVRAPAGLRLHRIVFKYGDVVRTKGDHGPYLDPPISRACVLAVCDIGEGSISRWKRVVLNLAALSRRLSGLPRDEAHAGLLR